MNRINKLILILIIYLVSLSADSQPTCTHDNSKIDTINIIVKPPHQYIENNLDSPWLQFMYQPSLKSTVSRYLTFKVGDPLNTKSINESIRKLRNARFIWDANYELVINTDCSTNVNLTVHDTFPFKPKLSLSNKNGTSRSSVGLVNSNVFGSGNRLQFEFKQEKLRDQKLVKYDAPNFGDNHYSFSGVYSNNSDGKETTLELEKPFHQFDSDDFYAVEFSKFNGDLQLFNATQMSFLSQHDTHNSAINYASYLNSNFNFEHSRLYFTIKQDQALYQNLAQRDRDLLTFGLKLELFDNNFVEVNNIRNMTKREDYNQGLSLSINFGLVYDKISQSSGKQVGINFEKHFKFDEQTLFLTRGRFQKQLFNNHLNSSELSSQFELNHFSANFQQSWNLKLNYNQLANPTLEKYITMNEEFPLRGYPYGYRLSDSLITLNIESRWFNIARYFDVFDIAAVSFLDAGVVSVENSDVAIKQSTNLQSFGFGLRISPTKLSNNTVVHIDLAFPQASDLEQNYQLNIFALSHF